MGGLATSDIHRVVAPNLDPFGILDEKRSWTKPKAKTHQQLKRSQSEVTEAQTREVCSSRIYRREASPIRRV